MRHWFFVLFILLSISLQPVYSHTLRPAIVNVSFTSDQVALDIETNAEALIAGISSDHDNTDDAPQAQYYKELRALSSQQLKQRFSQFVPQYLQSLNLSLSGQKAEWVFDNIEVPQTGDIRLARKSLIQFHAVLPTASSSAIWISDEVVGDTVINFGSANGDKSSHWIMAGESSPEFNFIQPDETSWQQVAFDYTALGFLHILPKGLDHILFVLGLFLLSRKMAPLLWQVTAFTLAHTITLALSIYGLISLPTTIIEPLIALSITYVGIENLMTRELKPWRILVVFVFGLLHGMGFAEVLFELGLPESEFVTALVAFNLGVEGGQLAVILLAFVAVFWLRKHDQLYYRLVVVPGSLMITLMGVFWFWERMQF